MLNKNYDPNDPRNFNELTMDNQKKLLDWVFLKLEFIKTYNCKVTSYRIKHLFEKDKEGFYIDNGTMKGAMLKAGYKVKDESKINWNFNVSKKSISKLAKKINGN